MKKRLLVLMKNKSKENTFYIFNKNNLLSIIIFHQYKYDALKKFLILKIFEILKLIIVMKLLNNITNGPLRCTAIYKIK